VAVKHPAAVEGRTALAIFKRWSWFAIKVGLAVDDTLIFTYKDDDFQF
jgi:hypothetical protein